MHQFTDAELAQHDAKVWSEGMRAGLDRGLDIAELVHEGHGRLDLTRVPAPPVSPYGDPERPKDDQRCGACWSCDPKYPYMRVCPTCGNKRCPHANDHRNTCTGSNADDQPGSAYQFPITEQT